MEIPQPSDLGEIDFGVLRDLLYVAFPKRQLMQTKLWGAVSLTFRTALSCLSPWLANKSPDRGKSAATLMSQLQGSRGLKARLRPLEHSLNLLPQYTSINQNTVCDHEHAHGV